MAQCKVTADQERKVRQVVWPLLPLLLRTARYLTGSDADAEDLVQETVIKAMHAIDRFQEDTDAKAWLLTILRRTHIDWLRAAQRRIRLFSLDHGNGIDPAAPEGGPTGVFDPQWDSPETILEGFEDAEVVAALKELPEEIRWTLLLVDVEDLDQTQAAAILDVPEGTIKSRAHRGRGMLRDRLFQLAQSRGLVRRKGAQV